jgi:hypothetical protein
VRAEIPEIPVWRGVGDSGSRPALSAVGTGTPVLPTPDGMCFFLSAVLLAKNVDQTVGGIGDPPEEGAPLIYWRLLRRRSGASSRDFSHVLARRMPGKSAYNPRLDLASYDSPLR